MTDTAGLSFGADGMGRTKDDRSPRSRSRSFMEETDLSGSDYKENTENPPVTARYEAQHPSKRSKGDSGIDFPKENMGDFVAERRQDPFGHCIIENTTLVLLDSNAERTVSMKAAGKNLDDDVLSEVSNATGTSSVANLRGWLDDFSKQQKNHYSSSASVGTNSQQRKNVPFSSSVGSAQHHVHFSSPAPAAPSLQRHFSSAAPVGSTFQPKRNVQSSTASGATPKKHFSSASTIGAYTPDQKPKQFSSSASVGAFSCDAKPRNLPPKGPRVHATPVRIMRPRHDDVAATNEERQPVSKLAAWLADDPTKSKKQIAQLRRGANILAKSRVFDKGLANVIIEEHNISAGAVERERRRWDQESVEPGCSLGALETSSCVSVSNKKEWLANAFNKKEDVVFERARTDVVTDRDKREDVTLRAKQMWRQRKSTTTETKPQEDPSTRAKELWKERSAACPPRQDCNTAQAKAPPMDDQQSRAKEIWRGRSLSVPRQNGNQTRLETPLNATPNNDQPAQATQITRGTFPARVPPQDENKGTLMTTTTETTTRCASNNDQALHDDDSQEEIDFRQARKLLIQRSKQNGYSCEALTKVTMKKAKFEKIARENMDRQGPNRRTPHDA